MTVELVQHCASDQTVVHAARVSTRGERSAAAAAADASPERDAGLINYLIRSRHGSPLEHNYMTFFVHAPVFVWREHMRHRIASYSEESGRYRVLQPVFYTPPPDRNLVQTGKAGEYTFTPGTPEQFSHVSHETRAACTQAYAAYTRMLHEGIAREVARTVLPLSIYSSAYVTFNARSLLNFLSLRTRNPTAAIPSFPQREIEMIAEQYETILAQLMPETHAAFNKHGRVAP
jgi:thymidylate synthase (FAD)